MDAQESSFGQLTQTPAVSSSTLSSSLEQQLYSAITSGDVKRTHQTISEVASPEINQLKLGPDGLSPLHVACEHGQEEIVQCLLAECECSIESCNSKGQSALHVTAQNGHIEIVKLLHQNWDQLSKREQLGSNGTGSSHELDQKSKPVSDGVSSEGLPHTSSSTGPLDSFPCPVDTATQETLSEPSGLAASFSSPGSRAQGLSVSFQFSCDISGNTALHLAAAGGQVPVIQYLLREADCSPTLTNNENQNAVHLAAKYGHVAVVRALVKVCKERQRNIMQDSLLPSDEDKTDSSVLSGLFTPDINGDTPLHLASAHGQLPVVQFLLCEVKCSLILVNNEKQNAIHLASKHGHVDVVKFLVETFNEKQNSLLPVGASEGSRDSQSSVAAQDPSKESSATPVSQSHRSASLCELLTGDINGDSPLHLAITYGQIPVINYLLHEVNCSLSVANNKGQSSLHLAVMLESQDVVKMLIQAIRKKRTVGSSDINFPGIGQKNSISSASTHDGGHNENQAKLPVQESGLSTSQINDTDCDGNTVLHLAAVHGNLPVTEYLLHEEDCRPTLANKTGQTALHVAAKHGHINIVKVLVEKLKQTEALYPHQQGAEQGEQTGSHQASTASQDARRIDTLLSKASKVSTPDNNGDTPLHLAAAQGHLPIVQYLLHEAKCSPTLVNHEGQSALHLAAKHGKMATIKYLIEEGCSSTATDKYSRTPLYLASEGGHLDIVKYLTLDRQCDPNTKTTRRWLANGYDFAPGLTPLHIASHKGHLDTVKFLVDELACDPYCTDENNYSSFYLACQQGHTEVILYFIEKLQLDSPLANALLFVAASNGCIDEVRYLIEEKKYNPACKINTLGLTPLHFASLNGHLVVIKFLVDEQQVDPACSDENGSTSLHLASGHGHFEAVKYFIDEKQCDILCRNSNGDTPLHCAALGGDLDVLKYFIIVKHCNPMERNQYGLTPLHGASKEGHLAVIKFLVDEQQVDPACADEDGNTSLHLASGYGHLEAVKYFVDEKQCDILCGQSFGNTPIHYTAAGGHLDILKYFIVVKHCSPMVMNQKGATPLHGASQQGHLAVIKFLVDEQQVDPACTDEDGMTSLHFASGCGYLETVKYFVEEKQCDILCRQSFGDTPIHYAAFGGHLDILKYFLVEKHCSPMERNKKGVTPLHAASEGGHLAVIKFLVDEQQVDPACTDEDGMTSLHFASGCGRLEAVKYFIKEKQCDILCRQNFGNTPIHYASEEGHLDILKYFIVVKHCSPMVKNQEGATPLHSASKKGHLVVIKFLVDEQKVNPACADKYGMTSLHYASQNGYLEAVKYFVEEKQCNILCRQSFGNTPIHYAAAGGHLDILKYFIVVKHCSPMVMNQEGATPLHGACQGGHLAVIKFLIDEQQVDPACTGKKRITPLHVVSNGGYLEAVKYLIEEKQCDIMCRQIDDITPLHNAASGGHLDVMKYLIDHHADPFQVDNKGFTPLYTAVIYGHLDIVKYLVEEKHCDLGRQRSVLTPAQLALRSYPFGLGNEDIIIYLLAKSTVVDRNDQVLKFMLERFPTLSSSVYVSIIGYRSSGKSTLTKAICDESSPISGRLFDVRGIVPQTAGIVPFEFQSKIFGKITLFDFAGHEEYYGSHETLLENITHPVILITVDLQSAESQLLKALKYWTSIVSRGIKKARTQANVIIVGSHFDKLKRNQVLAKTSLLNDFVQSQQLQDVNCIGWASMDCRKSISKGMTKLRQLLEECCKLARCKLDFNNSANLLHVFLSHKLTCKQAIMFSQLLDTLTSSDDHEYESLKNPPQLLEACESLNTSGHIVFLRTEDIKNSWIILNKKAIFSMAHGILKHIHTNENNAGIVPWTLIEEKAANPFLVVEYMLKMEFCSEVDPRSLQLIKGFEQRSPGRHFFFPDLISADRPQDISQPNPQYTYSFGWTLQCINSDCSNFFTPRFLQLLLIHLACKFALVFHPNMPPLLNPGCRIWKNGIRWVSPYVVEAIVELTKMNTAVVIVLRCVKDNNESVMHYLRLRSELVQEVFSIKDESLETHESLYLPNCLEQYPPQTDALISLSRIAKAVINKEPSIVVDNPSSSQCQNVMVKDLLLYDPFEKFGAELIRDLFSHQESHDSIPSKTFNAISVAAEDAWKRLASILEVDIPVVRRIELDQTKTEIDKCRLILDHWSSTKGTYSLLYQQLSNYSVFSKRNPLDFCPDLLSQSLPETATAKTTEKIITMSSVPTLKQLQNFERGEERLRLVQELTPHWTELAIELEFPYSIIEQIKIDNRRSADQCLEMLSIWLGCESPSSKEPTWESLVTAVRNIELEELADQVERMITTSQ